MPDLKCKCSTPYGQGWVIVTCKEESCLKCCPRTLLEDVTQSSKPTTEVANIVKNNVSNNDYIYLTSSVTGLQRKIPAPNFFPSINVVGKGSESVWISPLMQKNQINLKGFKSATPSSLTISTVDNNIEFSVLETGINLDLCNNVTSKFLTSVYLGPTTTTITSLDITGVLGATYGGTGLSTIAKGSVLYASAANTISAAEITESGQLLIGHATNGYPIPGYITSTDSSVTVSNYAGNIDLSVSTLAQLTADLDMGTKNINMNEAAGNSWISGDGTNEGILVAASGKVLVGDNLPTKPTIGGQLHLAGDSTAALVIGNTNNYKDHTISVVDAPSSTNAKNLTISGAAATSGNTNGGNINLTAGNGSSNGTGGALSLTAGTAPGTGAGGDITITAGESTSGDVGTVIIKGYDTSGSLISLGTFDGDDGFKVEGTLAAIFGGLLYDRGTAMGGHVKYQGNPATTADSTATITAANIATGLITCTPTADRNKAVDNATDLISGLNLTADNDSFDFTLINEASGGSAFDITLTGGTGITYVGNMHISAHETTDLAIATGSAQFRVRRVNSTSVTVYRLS